MSKFLKILNSVLNEQDNANAPATDNNQEDTLKPKPMDSEISSALPEEDEVALDVIKYQTLLKALKTAIYNSYRKNLEKQREISNIKTDTDDLKKLEFAENSLMSFLSDSESIPETEE